MEIKTKLKIKELLSMYKKTRYIKKGISFPSNEGDVLLLLEQQIILSLSTILDYDDWTKVSDIVENYLSDKPMIYDDDFRKEIPINVDDFLSLINNKLYLVK